MRFDFAKKYITNSWSEKSKGALDWLTKDILPNEEFNNILRVLEKHHQSGAIPFMQIASHSRLDISELSDFISDLESHGLVIQVDSKDSNYSKIISLTSEGLSVLHKLF